MISALTIYFTLFISSFLASTVVPFAPDFVVGYMAANKHSLFFIIAIAAAGSYLGACTTYFLGFLGREKILEKKMKHKKESFFKYRKIFEKYGAPILLFSWVPIAGDIFVGLAGMLKINFWIFSFYAILGKVIRFAFVAYLIAETR